MGLRLKFNLVLLAVFAIGLGATGYVSYELLHRNAREEVLRNAGVMMEAALSMRSYTVAHVRPNLTVDPDKFLPQSVPAFGATEIMNLLRKKYPDYAYKEATLNPTNLRNRAVEWETDIVHAFRNEPGRGEISGMRETPTGRSLYLARPFQIKDPACLSCHTNAAMAPAAMVKIYGAEQRLRLEAERGDRRADRLGADGPADPQRQPRFRHLHQLARAGVRGAVRDPEHHADASSSSSRSPSSRTPPTRSRRAGSNVAEMPSKGKDEVAQLGQAFNRMRRSLEKAISLIDKG